jgi:pilus assembly protein Flp/PilA
MNKFLAQIKRFGADEEGVTAIEYGLLASLIALAIIVGATATGTSLDQMFTYISTQLVTAAPAG